MFDKRRFEEIEESISLLSEHGTELAEGFSALVDSVTSLRETVESLSKQIASLEQADKQVSIARHPEGLEVNLIDRSMPLEKLISVAESILNRNQPLQTKTPHTIYV